MNYIDSSAFVKYYADEAAEKGANEVKKIIDDACAGKGSIVSSALLIGEVVSAMDKWGRTKVLTKEQFEEALSEFARTLKMLSENNSLILVDANISNVAIAVSYVVKHHLSINDALHLYTALVNKEMIDLFICSDKNLIRAAQQEGLEVFNPEEA